MLSTRFAIAAAADGEDEAAEDERTRHLVLRQFVLLGLGRRR